MSHPIQGRSHALKKESVMFSSLCASNESSGSSNLNYDPSSKSHPSQVRIRKFRKVPRFAGDWVIAGWIGDRWQKQANQSRLSAIHRVVKMKHLLRRFKITSISTIFNFFDCFVCSSSTEMLLNSVYGMFKPDAPQDGWEDRFLTDRYCAYLSLAFRYVTQPTITQTPTFI